MAVTLWSICRALKQLKLSYKKSRSMPPSRIAPMSREPCGLATETSRPRSSQNHLHR